MPITSLHEIVRVPEITAVPDAPDYLEGVINLRGKIVSVMDLRKRFGESRPTANGRTASWSSSTTGRLAGLIVDSASEVLKIPAEPSNLRPPFFRKADLNCVTGARQVRRNAGGLLDMSNSAPAAANERAWQKRRKLAGGSALGSWRERDTRRQRGNAQRREISLRPLNYNDLDE